MVTPLPDFENYQYQMVAQPHESRLNNTWVKYRETERRFEMYKWAESLNDPSIPKYRIFLNDCISAFLLTYEATFKFLNDELGDQYCKFMETQELNKNLTVRGLRTLRIFAAHYKDMPARSLIVVGGHKRPTTRTWKLSPIAKEEFDRLDCPKLKEEDIPKWNALADESSIPELLKEGMEKMGAILLAAEQYLQNIQP